jgi:hypothetical protein
VVDHVVVVQRLLDQQQVERVQLGQPRRVGQGIGRVGVHLQGQVGPALAHRAHHVHVPARLDLELDAGIAGRHVAFNLGQQLVQSRLDAHADADGHSGSHAAQHFA